MAKRVMINCIWKDDTRKFLKQLEIVHGDEKHVVVINDNVNMVGLEYKDDK